MDGLDILQLAFVLVPVGFALDLVFWHLTADDHPLSLRACWRRLRPRK